MHQWHEELHVVLGSVQQGWMGKRLAMHFAWRIAMDSEQLTS